MQRKVVDSENWPHVNGIKAFLNITSFFSTSSTVISIIISSLLSVRGETVPSKHAWLNAEKIKE